MPSDQCVIKNDILYLPVALRGLGEDRLRPIIASSIIFYYNRRIRTKEILAPLGFLVAPLFALIGTLALVGPILAPGGPPTLLSLLAIPLFVVWPFVVIFYGGYLVSMATRRLWLEADKIAAMVIGRETLLEAFKKIRDMGFSDESRLGVRRNYLLANIQDSQRPSLSERIDNLVKMGN
jgi:Zn-dependent protease with chaperone function